jgi:hypothetical protein
LCFDFDIAAFYTDRSMTIDAQLPLFRRRGGARRGAGRKPGARPRVRHLARELISGREPCHVTLKVVAGLRTLRDVRIVRALEATFRVVLGRADFRVVEYSYLDSSRKLVHAGSGAEV